MDANAWIATVAALIAAVALFFTGMAALATKAQAASTKAQAASSKAQADAAIEQTKIQQQLRLDAVQPYVWADLRPDAKQSQLLVAVVGNSGPTIATNVRVTFDPPLESTVLAETGRTVSELLLAGLPSLPPGRQMVWFLGLGSKVMSADAALRFTITVDADGPHGPLPQLRYVVDVVVHGESIDSPDGSLHLVRKAIEDVASAVKNHK
ncbi:hypothetical protein ACH47X_25385 [Promicromonospora kroppenstedtii]|uniref:Alternate signal-mediated exported protein, RER_14450 family n=1 Tax=Promicromonospora kroppenstedtii TaxID=440482 RepID=A0ABW7XRT9_9MICO